MNDSSGTDKSENHRLESVLGNLLRIGVIVSASGTTTGARPPVAMTAVTGPMTSTMRRTRPSTWPAKPSAGRTGAAAATR